MAKQKLNCTVDEFLKYLRHVNELAGQPVAVRHARRFRKAILRPFRVEGKEITETETDILRRHAKKNGKGEPALDDLGRFQFDDKGVAAVEKDWAVVLKGELEVEFDQVLLADLGPRIEISTDALDALDLAGIVVEEKPKPPKKKEKKQKAAKETDE